MGHKMVLARVNKKGLYCEHCQKNRHKKDTFGNYGKILDQKPRQNNINCGYQAFIDQIERIQKDKPTSSGTFNIEKMEQLYKMFSNFQTSCQSSIFVPFGSLAYKVNFLKALNITYGIKSP